MIFNDEWLDNMSSLDMTRFRGAIGFLLSATYLPRLDYDSEGKKEENAIWRFAKRHLPEIQEYLEIMGLDCSYDEMLEVVYITSQDNGPKSLKERPDKLTTDIIYTLRLLYDEFLEKNILDKDAIVNLSTIIRKICENYGITPKMLAKDRIRKSLALLEHHRIIKLVSGSLSNFDEAKFVIFPSIILVIPEERLYELSNLINERKEETSTSNSEEEFTDTDDEQFDELMEGDEPDEIL